MSRVAPKVAILLFDYVPMFELGCAMELFALPRPEIDGWYDTQVVSFSSQAKSTVGGALISPREITSLRQFDMLVIPGWDISNNHVKLPVAEEIVAFAGAGKQIVSFCSAAFLLAQLGLLDGKQATTHWRYAEIFKERFARIRYQQNVLYCINDNIACSAGSAAAIDLGIEIIRRDFGHDIANQVARRMVMSPHRQGGQAQYVESPVKVPAGQFADTLDWAIENLNKPLSIDDLADHAHMSRRSFDRHFRASLDMSPKHWLNLQRVAQARKILEGADASMDEVARLVGFDNAVTLRTNCRKYLGVSPTFYQAQFRKRSEDTRT